MNTKFKPLAAIIAVVFTWGFSFLSTKIALSLYSPITLGLIRNGLAALFLIPLKIYDARRARLSVASSGRPMPYPGGLGVRDYLFLALAGITGVSLYFVCENNGLTLVSVSEAAIFTGAIPVLVLLCEWGWGRLRSGLRLRRFGAGVEGGIKGRQWAGAFISITGVVLVSSVGMSISGSIRGYFFMSGAMLCWVGYCFLTRGLFRRASYITIVFWQTFFGFLGFIPFYVYERVRDGALAPVWPTLPMALHLLFLALFCSAFCFLFYVYALEKLGAAASSIFINLIPVVTVIAGFFLMGDRLSLLQWLGAAFTLAGVYLSNSQFK